MHGRYVLSHRIRLFEDEPAHATRTVGFLEVAQSLLARRKRLFAHETLQNDNLAFVCRFAFIDALVKRIKLRFGRGRNEFFRPSYGLFKMSLFMHGFDVNIQTGSIMKTFPAKVASKGSPIFVHGADMLAHDVVFGEGLAAMRT